MKPPPRTRTKPSRRLEPDVAPRASRKLSVDWPPVEQRKLLNALRSLGRTLDGCGDVDYAFLSKQVPTRSVSEIHSVVESLKNKVISCAKVKLKKNRLEDKKVKKPIEVWTHMASALAGSLEESISSAFYQILTVSSTEPCTLRNCDPPKVHRPPTGADRPVGRTVSLRTMPRLPVKGVRTDTSRPRPLFVMKTPSPILGPAHRLPAISKVVRVPNCRFPPPQHQPSPTAGVSTAATCSSLTAVTSNPPVFPYSPVQLHPLVLLPFQPPPAAPLPDQCLHSPPMLQNFIQVLVAPAKSPQKIVPLHLVSSASWTLRGSIAT
uniref:Uncharacterized protein n=1 Tax=Scophthalmus maximus TaxID=52904 RepID=A0A8D3A9W6_SCOMX